MSNTEKETLEGGRNDDAAMVNLEELALAVSNS
jgi:hypothetical protein